MSSAMVCFLEAWKERGEDAPELREAK